MKEPILNEHNKKEYPPMHTAEHLLNATMVKMFGCPRSKNAHIERKKSKCDYDLQTEPTEEQIRQVESLVNEAIKQHLAVSSCYMRKDEAQHLVDLTKLPDDATDTLRIVTIGDYDVCACIGDHVSNTSEIGEFVISSYTYKDGKLRLRFKLK